MTAITDTADRTSLRRRVARLLTPESRGVGARLVRSINIAVVMEGVISVIMGSDPMFRPVEPLLIGVPVLLFTVEYLARLWVAPDVAHCPDERPRLRWALSSLGLVDLVGAALIPLAWALGLAPEQAELLGMLWVFKLARYSEGLAVLGRVIRIEAEPLSGVLFAFVVVLLCAAALAHLIEGGAQPEAFGTVPRALWWTIVTLTTTGYGDVTPQTGAGRVLGGLVMMFGIMVFALWAGILATGFSQEMKRRAFLRTWDLVTRVPLFHDVGAAVISEVAQRLRPREVDAGTVITRRGEVGDCMYFIVHGEVRIEIGAQAPRMRDGDFFGEMSLITGSPRSASVVAVRSTQLLILDIADFRDLAARHPDLTNAIHQEAERRRGKSQPPAPVR